MKFSELILKSRRRIFDYRDASNQIISEAFNDGIRWSASDLVDSASEALVELTRDLVSYDFRNYVNTSVLTKEVGVTIETSGEVKHVTTSNIIPQIKRLIDTNGEVYDYISPEEFYSKDVRVAKLGDSEFVFTQYSADGLDALKIFASPAPSTPLPAFALYSVTLKDLFILTNLEELPFFDIDDIMLDYVERNCKLKEHDLAQADILSKVIDVKLSKLKARDTNAQI